MRHNESCRIRRNRLPASQNQNEGVEERDSLSMTARKKDSLFLRTEDTKISQNQKEKYKGKDPPTFGTRKKDTQGRTF